MNSNIIERERSLAILESKMIEISRLFRERYLKSGRGALVLYTHHLENNHEMSEIDYSSNEDAIELFDDIESYFPCILMWTFPDFMSRNTLIF